MKSSVAAILESDGIGWRVVVTDDIAPELIGLVHCRDGERVFIVPDYWVEQPIEWGRQTEIVERARQHLENSLRR